MAWTQAEIDTLQAAVTSGVLTVTYDGPPRRSITYQSLAEMRSLLATMTASVSGSPRFRLASTNKDLGWGGGGETGGGWGGGWCP